MRASFAVVLLVLFALPQPAEAKKGMVRRFIATTKNVKQLRRLPNIDKAYRAARKANRAQAAAWIVPGLVFGVGATRGDVGTIAAAVVSATVGTVLTGVGYMDYRTALNFQTINAALHDPAGRRALGAPARSWMRDQLTSRIGFEKHRRIHDGADRKAASNAIKELSASLTLLDR